MSLTFWRRETGKKRCSSCIRIRWTCCFWTLCEKSDLCPGILVVTAVRETVERQAFSLGADDVTGKPFDPIVIKQRLKNIATKKRGECALQTENIQPPLPENAAPADRVRRAAALLEQAAAGIQQNGEAVRDRVLLTEALHLRELADGMNEGRING